MFMHFQTRISDFGTTILLALILDVPNSNHSNIVNNYLIKYEIKGAVLRL